MITKKPRILTFTHYGELYGANRSLLTLLVALRDKIDWWVICKEESEFSRELRRQNIRYSIVPFTNDVYMQKKRFQWLNSIKRTVYNVAVGLYTAFIARKHGVDLIYTNSSVIFIGAVTSFFSRRKHIWHIREFVYDDYKLTYLLGERAFRFWANKASAIICISKSIQKRRVLSKDINVKSVIIYNGLVSDQSKATVRPSPVKPTVLGIVGVIDPAKNQLAAIKAVHELVKRGKFVVLNIVGSVSSQAYFETLKTYISEHGLNEYVNFTGFCKDVSAIFKSIDITLMCSPHEAFGRVTVESMMHGVPVVAYKSAGTAEIIDHEITGLLYHDEKNALTTQLTRLMTDDDLYKKISSRASKVARENFTIKSYADQFAQLVYSLTANCATSGGANWLSVTLGANFMSTCAVVTDQILICPTLLV
ncbi:glycosyltransferase family 4 protein [Dyadobacter endophyticus]|uniref:glycosyltransferase family 4 protein n=1 Tax=Dyadobacter TaxID=120831 RepID=UPI003CF248AD